MQHILKRSGDIPIELELLHYFHFNGFQSIFQLQNFILYIKYLKKYSAHAVLVYVV